MCRVICLISITSLLSPNILQIRSIFLRSQALLRSWYVLINFKRKGGRQLINLKSWLEGSMFKALSRLSYWFLIVMYVGWHWLGVRMRAGGKIKKKKTRNWRTADWLKVMRAHIDWNKWMNAFVQMTFWVFWKWPDELFVFPFR